MHRQLSERRTTAEHNQTSAEISAAANKFSYSRCLLRPLRLMWQVSVLSSKVGDTLGCVYKYAQASLDSFLCATDGKARRKERDGDQNSTDAKLYLEESVLERKLPEADLKVLVDLPAGLDYNEWLASHTLALFEHVNLVYGTISEFCTPSGCADMIGPGNRTYLWFDEKGKKTRVAAPQYIDYVMIFTQKTVSDESIFPTKYANEFPSSFESIARKILRLQFHVIAHLYAVHFREIALLGLHTHLNLTFAHLTALHRRFNLIDEKETDVLRDLELALRLTDDITTTTTTTTATTTTTTASLSSTATTTTTLNNINNTNIQIGENNPTTTTTTNHSVASGGHPSQEKFLKNTPTAATTTAAATTTTTTTTYNNNNNNNNNNNCNNHNYQHQQQQLNEMINNDENVTTTTTTATNLNEMTTIGTTGTTTTNNINNLETTTIIDGDANVPPICAQPETKPNKLTIVCSNNVDKNVVVVDLQQQFMYNKTTTTTTHDHVHTRLIQCNSSAAPSILAMQQQQQQQ